MGLHRHFRVLFVAGLLAGSASAVSARDVSLDERMLILRRARLWQETDPASMDLLNGPQGEGAYRFKDEVRCVFEERDPAFPIGGHTKKFPCVDAAKTRLKVKYDPSQNTEIFGEVAATRLFWALGFYAERMYSVRLACGNCPKDPFVSDAPPRAERVFEPVTLQKRLEGTEILSGEMEGWTFDELDLVEEARGGASKAQVDALKLLAVFVNHGDNTHNQQRILCPAGDPRCPRPILYVTDLGGTFGGKGYFTSLRNWTRKARIWKDPSACVADFEGMSPGYRDPRISEAGRAFLAGLLGRLSEKQVRDLFTGARFDALNDIELPLPDKNGKTRKATIEDWVRVFMDKRSQILKAKCPL
ncbi:MAG: hypothetical protein AAB339_05765 [Elusimicrobiota bacterium]